jgi:hypothetical protein
LKKDLSIPTLLLNLLVRKVLAGTGDRRTGEGSQVKTTFCDVYIDRKAAAPREIKGT